MVSAKGIHEHRGSLAERPSIQGSNAGLLGRCSCLVIRVKLRPNRLNVGSRNATAQRAGIDHLSAAPAKRAEGIAASDVAPIERHLAVRVDLHEGCDQALI